METRTFADREAVLAYLESASVPEPNTGCFLWLYSVRGNNHYGSAWVDGKHTNAHRAAWIANFGEIPDGMCVMHKCDVPTCINPRHLALGTHRENMDDRERKGRGPYDTRRTCKRGHSLASGDVYLYGKDKRFRCCRICKADLQRERRAAAKRRRCLVADAQVARDFGPGEGV